MHRLLRILEEPPEVEQNKQAPQSAKEEADASRPYQQFEAQTRDERMRVIDIYLKSGTLNDDFDPTTIALGNVKKSWIEQGIWDYEWNPFSVQSWKHERPLKLESESETDSEPGSPKESHPTTPFSPLAPPEEGPEPEPGRGATFPTYPQWETYPPWEIRVRAKGQPRRPKSDEEKQRIEERRERGELERQASRPYNQFMYQVGKECERIREEEYPASKMGGWFERTRPAEINARAYENIKNAWVRRKIWDVRWGVLPGMMWKHESPNYWAA
ncbi:MAG: hypothetical protein M1840_001421 [Geoglossum simile]|nr:MAG: hypothetical protein M1840_001421 [Geoglossum simile]